MEMSSPYTSHVVINLYQSCNEDSSKTFGRDNYRILHKGSFFWVLERSLKGSFFGSYSMRSKGHFLDP